MKLTTIVYAVLGAMGLLAAIAVPIMLYRNGSETVPLWTAAVNPGQLSKAHDFLGTKCEACHTPTRGVEAASCLTCHATAAPELLTKPSTAFHANVGTCAGCHVEHQGRDRRPINMDHSVLSIAGHSRLAEAVGGFPRDRPKGAQHEFEKLKAFLGQSGADLAGNLTRRPLHAEALATLDCIGCHTNQDRHRTLFGRECQSCHNVDAWKIAAFQHPSPRSQDCAQCHQAPPSHYMMHFEMMDKAISGQANARVDQCYSCHQTDSWNNIRGAGFVKHH